MKHIKKIFLGLKQFAEQIVRPNILLRRMFLGTVVFLIVVVLGLAYAFVGNKNKIISVKIGENIFKTEVAETMGQKAKGLSYRDSLDKDGAMYFDFSAPLSGTGSLPAGRQGAFGGGESAIRGFWMMGMRFPIDIIWIKNNVVVGIEKNALAPMPGTPESALKLYYPPEAVDKVLEINAGLSDELGIKVGDSFVIIN